MSKVDFLEIGDSKIPHTIPIIPRLEYSKELLKTIAEILEIKKLAMSNLNGNYQNSEIEDSNYLKTLNLEREIMISLEILSQIQNRLSLVSNITSIPKILPVTISLLRTINARLFLFFPLCSQKICELSVNLGSIVFDSAILTNANFDFRELSLESSIILDEVKLMADCKINKQYPNLDFFKLCNT